MSIQYNKLVRSKIPERIRADGKTPITQIVAGDEKLRAVLFKIVEEANEILENPTLEEFADLDEAVPTARGLLRFSAQQVASYRQEKAGTHDTFEADIYLIRVEDE